MQKYSVFFSLTLINMIKLYSGFCRHFKSCRTLGKINHSVFGEFWFKHSLLCCTVNPDHFSRRASTLFNLITQRKKIQFPCRNPLFHNYQPEIFYKNHIFAFYRFLSPCLVCYSNAEQLLADLIKICRRQIPLLIHNDTFWSICIWNFYFKVFKNLIFSFSLPANGSIQLKSVQIEMRGIWEMQNSNFQEAPLLRPTRYYSKLIC